MVDAPVSTIIEIVFSVDRDVRGEMAVEALPDRTSVTPPELCSTVMALPGSNSPARRPAIGISSSPVGIDRDEG